MGRTVFASDLRLPSLWCMLICYARGDLRGKGTSGQAAALRWSGLRCAPTALRCSALQRRAAACPDAPLQRTVIVPDENHRLPRRAETSGECMPTNNDKHKASVPNLCALSG